MQKFYETLSATNWQGQLTQLSAQDVKDLEKKSRGWVIWPGN
jgi:hypothetical protein